MLKRRLLLISNSRQNGQSYLAHAEGCIKHFLGKDVEEVLFIPWASVVVPYDEYAEKVRARFNEIGFGLKSIHEVRDPVKAVETTQAVVVGGGNTFMLLDKLYRSTLLKVIQHRIEGGIPYIGWSAGANIAAPNIMTTNDMPVVWPESVDALNLVPFQINPHYTDAVPPGFSGETREQRIAEFTALHKKAYVVCLYEGAMVIVEGLSVRLQGDQSAKVFVHGKSPRVFKPGDSLDFLLTTEEGKINMPPSSWKPTKKVSL